MGLGHLSGPVDYAWTLDFDSGHDLVGEFEPALGSALTEACLRCPLPLSLPLPFLCMCPPSISLSFKKKNKQKKEHGLSVRLGF